MVIVFAGTLRRSPSHWIFAWIPSKLVVVSRRRLSIWVTRRVVIFRPSLRSSAMLPSRLSSDTRPVRCRPSAFAAVARTVRGGADAVPKTAGECARRRVHRLRATARHPTARHPRR